MTQYAMTNAEVRRNAHMVVKNNFVRILLMHLASIGASLVPLLVGAIIGLITVLPKVISAAAAVAEYNSYYYSRYGYGRTIFEFLDMGSIVPAILLLIPLVLLSLFLLFGLQMGLNNGLIRMARGEEKVPITVIFSRLKNCFTGFGTNWWMSFKTSLWMLPGLGVMVLGTIISGFFRGNAVFISLGIFTVIGGIVMAVLVIMACYRYAMAPYFIADQPLNGTFGSVARSKLMMSGRKAELFRLTIPYILIQLAISMVVFLLNLGATFLLHRIPFLLTIVSLLLSLISMVATIAISMFTSMAQAGYYTAHCGKLADPEYAPLYQLTMHNRQIRKHTVTTTNMNILKVFVMDLLHNVISSVAFSILYFVMALLMMIPMVIFGNSMSRYDGPGAGFIIAMIFVFIIVMVLLLAYIMLMMALNLGKFNAHIKMARGENPPFTTLFSRLRNMLGGLGLSMWVSLKIFLWELPGFGAMLLGTLLVAIGSTFFSIVGGLLMIAGYIATLVLVIRAAFSYTMSSHNYADHPEKGVFNAVEESKWMMYGTKWQYFRLTFPFMWLSLGVLIVLMTIACLGYALWLPIGVILTVLAVLVGIVAMMYIGYLNTLSTACFYTKYSRHDREAAKARAKAAEEAKAAQAAQFTEAEPAFDASPISLQKPGAAAAPVINLSK